MKTITTRASQRSDAINRGPVEQSLRPSAPQVEQALPSIATQMDNAMTFGHHFERTGVVPGKPPGTQLVPQVTPAGDRYEREADRAAGQVVAEMDSPGQAWAKPQITPVGDGPAVQRETAGGPVDAPSATTAGPVQVPREASAGAQGEPMPAEVLKGIGDARGGGHPLPEEIRRPAERTLGADFSGVRVHTTSLADRLNRQLNADAFTSGRDLFFRHDTFEPDSPEGKRLIAHELTHVVQQRQQAGSKIQRSTLNPPGTRAPTGRKKNKTGHHDPAKTPGKARPKGRLKEYAARSAAATQARQQGLTRLETKELLRQRKAKK